MADTVAAMVSSPDYPCLGARSVLRRDTMTVAVLDDLSDQSTGGSLDHLGALRSGSS